MSQMDQKWYWYSLEIFCCQAKTVDIVRIKQKEWEMR